MSIPARPGVIQVGDRRDRRRRDGRRYDDDQHEQHHHRDHRARSPAGAAGRGPVAWYEIQVPDLERATAFYTAVFGATAQPWEQYVMLVDADGRPLCALEQSATPVPQEPAVRIYFQAPDLEAACEAVVAAGRQRREGARPHQRGVRLVGAGPGPVRPLARPVHRPARPHGRLTHRLAVGRSLAPPITFRA